MMAVACLTHNEALLIGLLIIIGVMVGVMLAHGYQIVKRGDDEDAA